MRKWRRQVAIHCNEGGKGLTFEGVYVGRAAGHYVLKAATMREHPSQEPVSLKGEALIPVQNVVFLQRL